MESISRDMEDKLKNLEEVLECPVCLSVPRTGTPVYECSNSHIICGSCAKGIPDRKCPTCRVIFSVNKSSRIVEKLIAKLDLTVPCFHNDRGCYHYERSSEIKDHEANCGSRPVQCPSMICNMTVNLNQLIDHAKQYHGTTNVQKVEDQIVIREVRVNEEQFQEENILSGSITIYKLDDGQTYISIVCKKQNIFRAMLYILASPNVALKHRVTISISGKDYKASYTTNTVPIDTPVDEATNEEENCLSLSNYQAKRCVSKEDDFKGNLSFEFKVVKCQWL
jgi:hypothetical protein